MLKSKRVIITGGGSGFGQALVIELAKEGAIVEFTARKLEDIEKTCSIVAANQGVSHGYLCNLNNTESINEFVSKVSKSERAIDVLILNATQWLSGTLEEQTDQEIINTIDSGLTGSIILTRALLPKIRASSQPDIISIVSACAIPNFTDSIAHPAFFASKHGMSGFITKIAQELKKDNVRVTALYPPDFELRAFDEIENEQVKMGEKLLNAKSIWETIRFILSQPRSCHIGSVYFEGPTREDLAQP